MNSLLSFLSLLVVFFCCNCASPTEEKSPTSSNNSEILLKLYQEDQSDRKSANIDWEKVTRSDSLRKLKTYELLAEGLVVTATDYYRAAMIFQHNGDTVSSMMAVNLMKKAIQLNPSMDRWLLAAAIDRDLMNRNQPQIYGTQFVRQSPDCEWEQYHLDATQVTDEERVAHGVETLAEQKEKLKWLNNQQEGF